MDQLSGGCWSMILNVQAQGNFGTPTNQDHQQSLASHFHLYTRNLEGSELFLQQRRGGGLAGDGRKVGFRRIEDAGESVQLEREKSDKGKAANSLCPGISSMSGLWNWVIEIMENLRESPLLVYLYEAEERRL
ncbi:hypothetical protein F2Q69_00047084 [Brassica cretica]|uniref:Uncharacterized protein n=1 Tax=Brassica cretica TaxID=69181 RepID=A0A8S9PP40_BRACR|nr:hypothetical protein F2Q69_00047084 [Brassica cretica]